MSVEEFKKPKKDRTMVERRIDGIDSRMEKLDESMKELKATFNEFGKLVNGNLLKQARADSKHIHDLYEVVILKLTVIEMAYLAAQTNPEFRQVANTVALEAIRAITESDQWWKDKKTYTLETWVRIFLKRRKERLNR